MSRSFKSFLTFIALGLLLGCSFPGDDINLPFFGPQASASPAVSATPEGGGANLAGTVAPAEPSATPTGTATPVPPTVNPALLNLPTITATPTLDSSDMLLRIAVPGPMSKVVSPIDFVVYISPDFTGSTRIQLLGEDGRELYSKVFRTHSNIDYTTRVEENINFEIHGAAEVGRLQISTADEFGRMQAFNSVRLLLLSVGENQLTQAYPALERVLLRVPKKGDEVRGGVLAVEGEIQPVNDSPLVLELYDSDGNIMGSRILTLRHADGTYQPFNTIIPYQAGTKVPARLMIRQSDDRIEGLAYLYSVKLLIDP